MEHRLRNKRYFETKSLAFMFEEYSYKENWYSLASHTDFRCSHDGSNRLNLFLAYFIDSVPWQDIEEYVLNEMLKYERGQEYEAEFWTDYFEDDLIIKPPFVIWENTGFKIEILIFKNLLKAWVDFCKLNK
ncbi:MAG: hypothetical protein AB8B53_10640 [Flavobacteriales bacterium]